MYLFNRIQVLFYFFDCFLVLGMQEGAIQVELRQVVLSFEVQNPSVRVEIDSIVRVLANGYFAHPFRFLQVAFMGGEVISVVVQDAYVAGLDG